MNGSDAAHDKITSGYDVYIKHGSHWPAAQHHLALLHRCCDACFFLVPSVDALVLGAQWAFSGLGLLQRDAVVGHA